MTDPEDRPTDRPAEPEETVVRPTVDPKDFGKTGPMPPISASDVLDVFALFQTQILTRIELRDRNILDAIKRIGSDVFAQYERIARQGDDNRKWIEELRKRGHTQSSSIQQLELRMYEVEIKIGLRERVDPSVITPPGELTDEETPY